MKKIFSIIVIITAFLLISSFIPVLSGYNLKNECSTLDMIKPDNNSSLKSGNILNNFFLQNSLTNNLIKNIQTESDIFNINCYINFRGGIQLTDFRLIIGTHTIYKGVPFFGVDTLIYLPTFEGTVNTIGFLGHQEITNGHARGGLIIGFVGFFALSSGHWPDEIIVEGKGFCPGVVYWDSWVS